ncbi:MAG: Kae1-associated kinase Bud32 [Candidatus Baldrarchaeia archaeon]
MEIIKKGAEAWIIREEWYGFDAIRKMRIPKRYRIPELDMKLRMSRTRHEARILLDAKKAGVPTPALYFIDLESGSIIMERIEGQVLKDILDKLSEDRAREICREIGRLVGKLHNNGIIHGDLTTSNMILSPDGRIVFIDFGLAEYSKELEDRAVDIHLMRRALESTHYEKDDLYFKWIMEGYFEIVGESAGKEVLERVEEIRRRGRYVKERKRQG